MKPILSIINGTTTHGMQRLQTVVVQHKIGAPHYVLKIELVKSSNPGTKSLKVRALTRLRGSVPGGLCKHIHTRAYLQVRKRWDDVHVCPCVCCSSLRFHSEKCGSWSLTGWPPLLRLYRFLFTQYKTSWLVVYWLVVR